MNPQYNDRRVIAPFTQYCLGWVESIFALAQPVVLLRGYSVYLVYNMVTPSITALKLDKVNMSTFLASNLQL